MSKKKPADEVSIGKFDILTHYTYAKAHLDGLAAGEARERGMAAAVMGAKSWLGHRGGAHDDHEARKDAAQKKTGINAEWFDHQVADKTGEVFEDVFLPTMRKLVEPGCSATR